MKIVSIFGGLGNQMFQYAFAIALKQKYQNEVVKIDTQLYRFPIMKTYKGNNFYHNGFEINKVFPNSCLSVASWFDIMKVSYYLPNYILNRAVRRLFSRRRTEFIQSKDEPYIFNSEALTIDASFFEGYWFSPKYFDFCRQKILEAFYFPPFESIDNQELAKILYLSNSVTIHIRRGDYLNNPLYKDICTIDYYKRAVIRIKELVENPVFYIFSNDQEWCKQNLSCLLNEDEMVFVNNNKGEKSYLDMQLMSISRCNILANSSFSWWGAYLNQRDDHIVIAPCKWVNIPCNDVYCSDWIKI